MGVGLTGVTARAPAPALDRGPSYTIHREITKRRENGLLLLLPLSLTGQPGQGRAALVTRVSGFH